MKLMTILACLVLLVIAHPLIAADADPLSGITITPADSNIPDEIRFFLGHWEGVWMGDVRAYRDTIRLVVSEVSKDTAIVSTARNTLVVYNKEKAKIKQQPDGRYYIEIASSVGTLTFVGYPETNELKAKNVGRSAMMEATLKRKSQ